MFGLLLKDENPPTVVKALRWLILIAGCAGVFYYAVWVANQVWNMQW